MGPLAYLRGLNVPAVPEQHGGGKARLWRSVQSGKHDPWTAIRRLCGHVSRSADDTHHL